MAKYDVDDILAEIKRKKAAQQGGVSQPSAASRPVSPAPSGRDIDSLLGSLREEKSEPKPAAPQPSGRLQEQTIAFDLNVQHPAGKQRPQPPALAQERVAAVGKTPAAPEKQGFSLGRAMQESWNSAIADVPVRPAQPEEETPDGFEEARRRRVGAFHYQPEEDEQEMLQQPGEDADAGLAVSPLIPPQEDLLHDEPELASGTIDDYNEPEDAPSIRRDLRMTLTSLFTRFTVTAVCFILLLYLGLSLDNIQMPLPTFMHPETQMRNFMLVNTGILVIAALVCNSTVGGGMLALFTGRADNDTLTACATIFCMIQGMVFCVFPESVTASGIHLYFPVAALALLFNTVGKVLMIRRIARNFKLVSAETEKYALENVEDHGLARALVRGLDVENIQVVCSARTGFLTRFLEQSYAEDISENVSRIAAPICLAGSLVVSVISYLFDRDLFLAVSVFTAILCICAPFGSTIVGSLPMSRLSSKLLRAGAMVSGYRAVEKFQEASAVLLRENDLFPQGNVELHGIKAFAEGQIDSAILDVASVICAGDGPLKPIFVNIIGGNLSMLKPVEQMSFEDGMGISARVGGRHVLIGNAQLMRSHGVDTPSHDFESRYRQNGRELLYLANSGELMAMFVLSYRPDEAIAEELARLSERDLALVIHTTDPNITPQKISELYGYPADLIKTVPSDLFGAYDSVTAGREQAVAYAAYTGHAMGLFGILRGLPIVRQSIWMGVTLNLAGTIIGYTMVTFFAFMGGMGSATFLALIAFQLFWVLAAMLVPNLKRL